MEMDGSTSRYNKKNDIAQRSIQIQWSNDRRFWVQSPWLYVSMEPAEEGEDWGRKPTKNEGKK